MCSILFIYSCFAVLSSWSNKHFTNNLPEQKCLCGTTSDSDSRNLKLIKNISFSFFLNYKVTGLKKKELILTSKRSVCCCECRVGPTEEILSAAAVTQQEKSGRKKKYQKYSGPSSIPTVEKWNSSRSEWNPVKYHRLKVPKTSWVRL